MPPPAPPPAPQPAAKERKSGRKRSAAGIAKRKQRGVSHGFVAEKRERELTEREAQVEAGHQQNMHDSEQLVRERAALRAREADDDKKNKQLRRDAASAIARGHRCERWADELVHGETGEIRSPEARMISLRAQMMDAGASPQAATRAAAQVRAQRLTSVDPDPNVRALSVLHTGMHCWFISTDGKIAEATITAVHSDVPPYYTISFENGHERNTLRSNLIPM